MIGAWLFGPITAAWLEWFFIAEEFWIPIPDTTWMIREPIP
jgi:hypothetical protein